MTDEEIDNILSEISDTEDPDNCCRFRDVINDREALQWAAQAIVETLRQIRDRLPAPAQSSRHDPKKCTCLDWPNCTCKRD